MQRYDVLVIGGGAAGLFCALTAGRRGRSVLVLEGSNRVGKKILMSGGGRCNFTHLHSTPEHFISANPHFCKSALARFTPEDFLALVERHGIAYHEKTPGQLFCDHSSKDIVRMLEAECQAAGVSIRTGVAVADVTRNDDRFAVRTDAGLFGSDSLVIATGGLSIPKMGASDFGYRLARQFGLTVLPTRAGLVPFTFTGAAHALMQACSGNSVTAAVASAATFTDGLLFTHRGLSGPAALQCSSYWNVGTPLTIDLVPGDSMVEALLTARQDTPRQQLLTVLARYLPKALASAMSELLAPGRAATPLAELGHATLRSVGEQLNRWTLTPSGTEGYRTAEVTLGGVDTDALDSKTLAARQHPGLYFIGEVVDVTGHLGGHNFQWAWASGFAAGSVA